MTTLEKLQEYLNNNNNIYCGCEISSHEAKEIVKALQFHQSVVRCKDCDLRYQYPQNVFCNRHIGKVHDDGFCFEGKQREEKK